MLPARLRMSRSKEIIRGKIVDRHWDYEPDSTRAALRRSLRVGGAFIFLSQLSGSGPWLTTHK